jgi:hypothetical protein
MDKSEAPEELDGAIVIKWMWSEKEPFGYIFIDLLPIQLRQKLGSPK